MVIYNRWLGYPLKWEKFTTKMKLGMPRRERRAKLLIFKRVSYAVVHISYGLIWRAVCLSVKCWCFLKANERRIRRSSPAGSQGILVTGVPAVLKFQNCPEI